MALATKLELRQSQQLVMTPQLQQAIRLLQLSNLELNAFIESELERNPLLEREEPGDADAPERSNEDIGSGDARSSAEVPLAEAAAVLDTDIDNVFPDSSPADLAESAGDSAWAPLRTRARSSGADEQDHDLEAYVSEQLSLKDHLVAQLHVAAADAVDRLIGLNLIDLVDDAGYLPPDLAAVADRLGAPMD